MIRHAGGWRLAFRTLTAAYFAVATGYTIYRFERFDVFRGVPGPKLLAIYASYIVALGAVGWILAALLTPKPCRLGRSIDR